MPLTPEVQLPAPPFVVAIWLILVLGMLGVVLLWQQLVRVFADWGAARRRVSKRLAALPAAGLDVWPLLLVFGWGLALTALQMLQPESAAAALPTSLFSLLSGSLLQTLLMVLAIAVCMRHAEHGWRLLLGAAGSDRRESVRAAVGAGLRGGIMLLMPVWLLALCGALVLQRIAWPLEQQQAMQWLAGGQLGWAWVVVVIFTALVVAPVVEEVAFRGILLPVLARHGMRPWRALLLSSLLFAALHMHAGSLLPLVGVGLGCGLGYIATGHLLTPIVMHALFNASSLLSLFAMPG